MITNIKTYLRAVIFIGVSRHSRQSLIRFTKSLLTLVGPNQNEYFKNANQCSEKLFKLHM